ncbi:hypothetical protein SAMN05216349_10353 [Oribacterium sp. KHPX15]|uniref:hypothetical protein n=1 Tax=Oribacterium sp. KHPX15 TaxID=1855342 RepID=UPI00089AB9B3|nr:hypothetical protein [Oribacterium sp. KHPX15]SDZ96603.1 hypothetical protein SAMN05216349_10353 [Oribacterium sp. KHPX15]
MIKIRNFSTIVLLIIIVTIIGGCGKDMNLFRKKTTENKTTEKNTEDTKTLTAYEEDAKKLTTYAEDLTGLTLKDICLKESGEIESQSRDEYAYICLDLQDGGIKTLEERLDAAGKEALKGSFTVPGFNGHELAKKMKSETILGWYTFFLKGKGNAMTRSVEVFLTEDEENKGYMYLFG